VPESSPFSSRGSPGACRGVLAYVLTATAAGILGGIVALFWTPSIRARSAIQHFAAGLVIAAVASDVIPEVERIGTAAGILAGFAAGGLVMLFAGFLVVLGLKLTHPREAGAGDSARRGFRGEEALERNVFRPKSEQVREQPVRAGHAGGELAEEREPRVDVLALSDLRDE
jgi:hypothetical protein